MHLKINEIFFSIQGESSFAGWPTVFVRTTGCNLRCTYCDTKYSYYDGQKMTLNEITEKVVSYSSRHVCITGGEPLAQPNTFALIKTLCDLGKTVSVETSGSFDISEMDPRAICILDIKTPASGEEKSFVMKNLDVLRPTDQIKFVICDDRDFEWSRHFVTENKLNEKCMVFFSPAFDTMPSKTLAEKILSSKLDVRLQLQLHKYIWSPTQRGV